ncbi:MAG: HRDC domain-containing protein, partial [Acidimicrobiia bacterium]
PASPVLAALLAWRDEHARAARVEPAAVVDDRLLERIAERRPRSHEELVELGMGPLVARRLGDGLLAALRDPVTEPG